MDDYRPARLVLARETGARLDPGTLRSALSASISVITAADIPGKKVLAAPFEEIPILPERAAYSGQPLAVLVGGDWDELDAVPDGYGQSVSSRGGRDLEEIAWEAKREINRNAASEPEPVEHDQIVEGSYTTPLQLHQIDQPLWASCREDGARTLLYAPTQWPEHVHASVNGALGLDGQSVEIIPIDAGATRDGALHIASQVATLAAIASFYVAAPVLLRLRLDQRFLTGGRAPSEIRWTSRLTASGDVRSTTVSVDFNLGAYAALKDEFRTRAETAVSSVYDQAQISVSVTGRRTSAVPMVAFEGLATSQIAFAREVHFNRLAELAHADPIEWRRPRFRSDMPALGPVCDALAEESDFHRRHAANELVRKRRLLLPRYSSYLKGIGFALSEQLCGFHATGEPGFMEITLEKGGTARLRCTVPTPNPRLKQSWRSIVADELALDHEAVAIEDAIIGKNEESGPRLFSRGVTVIPRRIVSACQGIQKRRFRDPLPIHVRRSLSSGRAVPELKRSIGCAAVEASILPATMQIEVRSVTMAVHAGRVLDRGSAEAELRRGIFQSLAWALHESFPDPLNLADPELRRRYDTTFRGRPPRIRIVFVTTPVRREFSAGIGELPFLTVPAALISALSQASGLYLDALPTRPRTILDMLTEE